MRDWIGDHEHSQIYVPYGVHMDAWLNLEFLEQIQSACIASGRCVYHGEVQFLCQLGFPMLAIRWKCKFLQPFRFSHGLSR